jgi:4'-phosphopantetheinyl transferase
MDEGPLHLWCANPDDVSGEPVAQACAQLLSEDERARWQRFRFEKDRREYLTTRVLMRVALSHHHPRAPATWRFELNACGKPAAQPDCGLRFNLSNSSRLVVCLIARRAEVGVDVEPNDRAGEIAELAPAVFSRQELAQLAALSGQERLGRALSLWTLKEAYIKARGMGLSLPMNKFSFLFDAANGIRLELDPGLSDVQGGNWRFCLVDHAGHRIALMAERRTPPELQLWKATPLLAPPTRFSFGEVRWFAAS